MRVFLLVVAISAPPLVAGAAGECDERTVANDPVLNTIDATLMAAQILTLLPFTERQAAARADASGLHDEIAEDDLEAAHARQRRWQDVYGLRPEQEARRVGIENLLYDTGVTEAAIGAAVNAVMDYGEEQGYRESEYFDELERLLDRSADLIAQTTPRATIRRALWDSAERLARQPMTRERWALAHELSRTLVRVTGRRAAHNAVNDSLAFRNYANARSNQRARASHLLGTRVGLSFHRLEYMVEDAWTERDPHIRRVLVERVGFLYAHPDAADALTEDERIVLLGYGQMAVLKALEDRDPTVRAAAVAATEILDSVSHGERNAHYAEYQFLEMMRGW